MNTNLQYRRTVEEWGLWVAGVAVTGMTIVVAADVVWGMIRQGQDMLAILFSLGIYGALCWAGKAVRK